MSSPKTPSPWRNWRNTVHDVVFGHGTFAGRLFDVVLVVCILLSVVVVMLDSVPSIEHAIGSYLTAIEWFFTVLFTIEYALRVMCARNAFRYVTSFYGIIDLLSTLPTYLNLVFAGTGYLLVIRILRVFRIFRILKLLVYTREADILARSLVASRRRIAVFFSAVLILVVLFGSVMYLIEGEENGFTSIPRSIYWAIVTLTTVGYGDITPKTVAGRFIASIVMLLGYSIIAIPTGIVTAEMVRSARRSPDVIRCPGCGRGNHDDDARFCKLCGNRLGD